jgi:lysozyme
VNRDRLADTIRNAEGFSQAYEDNGQHSGGYGHKLPACWPLDAEITREQSEDWLQEDINIAQHAVDVIFHVPDDTTDVREEGLVEMAYNLGQSRLSKFVNMIAAVNAGDWSEAANQATASAWFNQVGQRAVRIVGQLRNG